MKIPIECSMLQDFVLKFLKWEYRLRMWWEGKKSNYSNAIQQKANAFYFDTAWFLREIYIGEREKKNPKQFIAFYAYDK